MNRAARRAAQAKKRQVAKLTAKIPVLERIVYLKKQKLSIKREEFLRSMDDVVDGLADEANGFMAKDRPEVLRRQIEKKLDEEVDEEFAEALIRAGWKDVTSKEEALDKLARAAVDRSIFKSDLAFALCIVDGFAVDVLSTIQQDHGDQDVATAVALVAYDKVRAKLADGAELEKMRDRLADYGWRGATKETIEQRFARAVGQRVIELRRNPNARDMVIERELSKHPKSEEENIFERFRRRVKFEEETIDIFRDAGFEAVAATDSPSGVDGFAIDRALAATGALLVAPLIEEATGHRGLAATLAQRAQHEFAGAMLARTEVGATTKQPLTVVNDIREKVATFDSKRVDLDRDLMQFGQRVWEESYGQGFGENVAQAWVDNELDELAKIRMWDEESRRAMGMALMFAGQWAVHAFQRVQTSHTFAAALMCTDPDKASLESIQPQWKAFSVMVPNGLLTAHLENGELYEFTRILVAVYSTKAHVIMMCPGHKGGSVGQASESPTLAEALAGDIEQQDTEEKRAFVMAKRLVAGLLLAMQEPSNYKKRDVSAKSGKQGKGDGEPAHRLVIVGHPITVDVRDEVRRYIEQGPVKRAHGHAPPAVRFVVRGHFREQAHGPRRSLRKTIWIKPFWKGVEGMPIVTSPKKLPGASS